MSSLSIEKLQYFVKNNGYEIHKIFTKNSNCFLVELMSVNTIDFILLYIPEKYKFNVPDTIYTYPLVEVSSPDASKKTDDINDYIHVSERIIESSYSDMENIVKLPVTGRNLAMSEHLNHSYRENVILDDIEGNDDMLKKDIYRQIRRLKYCIKGMPHRIAIMNAQYIGILDTNDNIIMYHSENLQRKSENPKKLYIVIDFKMFYDKINTMEDECSQLLRGIYGVLNNNQKIHAKNITHIMNKRDNIAEQSCFLQKCKAEYMKYIDQYVDLLEELNSYERSKEQELDHLKIVDNDNIHSDMKRSHKKQKIEKEIREMTRTKRELISTVKDVKTKNEHLALSIDTILFDNIVMLNKIFENFAQLDQLEKKLR